MEYPLPPKLSSPPSCPDSRIQHLGMKPWVVLWIGLLGRMTSPFLLRYFTTESPRGIRYSTSSPLVYPSFTSGLMRFLLILLNGILLLHYVTYAKNDCSFFWFSHYSYVLEAISQAFSLIRHRAKQETPITANPPFLNQEGQSLIHELLPLVFLLARLVTADVV
jgi:hypothetical protein